MFPWLPQLTAAKHDTNRRKTSSHKKCIDELCHFMRRKQIKVLDIKRITNELLIPPGPQTDQLLLQPTLCIPNSHFTRLHTKQNQQLHVAHCHIGDLLLIEWWGRRGQCNTAGWLVRHLAYAPHYERRAAVRGADNGQNMCHGVEVGCQHCSVSVSTRTRKTLSHSLLEVFQHQLLYLFLVVRQKVCCISSRHHLICHNTSSPNVSFAHVAYNVGVSGESGELGRMMGWIANCSITKNSSIRSGKRLRRFIAASKVTDDSPVK